jgi:hypothetical protein
MRKAVGLAGMLAIAGGVLFAQGTRVPGDGTGQEALLVEVRALRAELHEVTQASIRKQLLVARLQLQEQRVVAAARQLEDAQHALTSVRTEIARERIRFRQLEDAASRASGQHRLALQEAIRESGAQIEQRQEQALQLQTHEAELTREVGEAQARWAEFSGRLDDVERALSVIGSR